MIWRRHRRRETALRAARRGSLSSRVVTAGACVLLSGLLALSAVSSPAMAQGPSQAALRGLLATERPLRVGVIGDSLATDLWYGLSRVLRSQKRIEVVRFARPATGLVRDDVYDWYEALRGFVARNRFDVVAVMIGGNDRQSVYVEGKRLERFTGPWMNFYGERVSRFMDIVAASGATVHWVGLPPVRSDQMTRDYERLNEVYRAQAARNGFGYVSVWEDFSDQAGNYSSFGHTVAGERRRLRMKDGLHFTNEGQTRLGQIVAGAISRGMMAAR